MIIHKLICSLDFEDKILYCHDSHLSESEYFSNGAASTFSIPQSKKYRKKRNNHRVRTDEKVFAQISKRIKLLDLCMHVFSDHHKK